MVWVGEACFGWLRRMSSSGEVLDVPLREVTAVKRIIYDAHVKHFFRSVPVNFRPGRLKILKEACVVVNTAYSSSSGFPSLSDDVPFVEHELVEADALWNIRELAFKNDSGPSTFQQV